MSNKLDNELELARCPYCRVDKPNLRVTTAFRTTAHNGLDLRFWKTYACSRCGGVVIAASDEENGWVREIYPQILSVSDVIPEPARTYLNQAIDSLHAPAGSVMLAASSVDAMLKAKSYKDGSLYSRINSATKDHLITEEMAKWAHEVRLDANEQRHVDEKVDLPTTDDAKRCVEFALALGEFLFVLPSRVSRGLEEAASQGKPPNVKN